MASTQGDNDFLTGVFDAVVIKPTRKIIVYFQEAINRSEKSDSSQLISIIVAFLILSIITFIVSLVMSVQGYGFSSACLLNIATEFAAGSFLLFVIEVYLGNVTETKEFRETTQTQLTKIANNANNTEHKLTTLERQLIKYIIEQRAEGDSTLTRLTDDTNPAEENKPL